MLIISTPHTGRIRLCECMVYLRSMDHLGHPFFNQRTRSAPASFFHLEQNDLAERGELPQKQDLVREPREKKYQKPKWLWDTCRACDPFQSSYER